MSNLASEQIQAILEGAPEGTTHCTDTVPSMNLYAKVEHLGGFYVSLSNRWESYPIYAGIHLLSDLREILTLRQEMERLKAQQSEVAARAVEKAVRKYRMRLLDGPDIFSDGLLDYAKQLREQGHE